MSEAPSYIDYETFLSPSFSPQSFANSLILGTNNATDTSLDLSTPLSRVLFDIQEIDTHIHNLTTKSALPILDYVKGRDEASKRILATVEEEVEKLGVSYQRLEREVLERYAQAEVMRLASLRSLEVLRLGRGVGRAVGLGRQLEIQMSEAGLNVPGRTAGKEDYRAMVRAVYTILDFRGLVEHDAEGEELQRVNIVQTLKTELFTVVEERLKNKAQQTIREFSISGPTASTATTQTGAPPPPSSSSLPTATATFLQTSTAKSATTSAITALYLLSPITAITTTTTTTSPLSIFHPALPLLLPALKSYLQTSLTSSLTSLTRALTTLPTLERTLVEVSARCQNVVALEMLLRGMKPPLHPLRTAATTTTTTPLSGPSGSKSNPADLEPTPAAEDGADNLLTPLLTALETPSLPSYFWRSLASALAGRVVEIMGRGGVSARTLRSNRERVGGAVRECVFRGVEGVGGGGSWEREAAVMVGSVIGGLGR